MAKSRDRLSASRRLVAGLAAMALVGSTGPGAARSPSHPAGFGFDLAGMDRSVSPGDDFYAYANGAWDAATPIPDDQPSIGTYQLLQDRASEQVRTLIEEAANRPGSKVGDFYASFMDEAEIARCGIEPLRPWLAAIDAAADHAALAREMGRLARSDVGGPFGIGVGQDDRDAGNIVATLRQGGLGMPNRDFYLSDAPAMATTRAAYGAFLARLLTLAGEPDAEGRAERVLAFETSLAQAHWTAAESRDSVRIYNRLTLAELDQVAPGFPWRDWLEGMGVPAQPFFVVQQPSAMASEAVAFAHAPLPVLKDYVRLRLLGSYARYLPATFEAARFAFYGRTLAGTQEPPPRWRRGVGLASSGLRDLVGQAYVARYFPPEAEAQMRAIVSNVVAALDDQLAHAAWMTERTRRLARAKLAATRIKIGHPSIWQDYSGLEIARDDIVGNIARLSAFEFSRQIRTLGSTPNRDGWVGRVTDASAIAGSTNEVIFPAAILQPPLFDPHADSAVNYAGIGATIGHELIHLFDDQGRRYDAGGRLADWWTPEDSRAYQVRVDALIDQYDVYEPLVGQHIQGALTVGENIADLAGLELALAAYHRSLRGQGRTIAGFTPDQRFFLGWAQMWRDKSRDNALRARLASDPHAPGRERMLTVRNVDAWYVAFGVTRQNRLYLPPSQRVRFW